MKRALIISFLLAAGLSANAQIQTRPLDPNNHTVNTWKGGKPGREADWNIAANWSLHRVPDWTQDVYIPDMSATARPYPILQQHADVHSLQLQSGAEVTITETGSLQLPEGLLEDAMVIHGYLDTRFEHLAALVNPTAMVPK